MNTYVIKYQNGKVEKVTAYSATKAINTRLSAAKVSSIHPLPSANLAVIDTKFFFEV